MSKKIMAVMMCCIVTMCSIITAFAENTSPTVSPLPTDDINITVDGKTLVKDKDYTLSYRDNVKVGTATVVVTFIGNYSGQREVTFDIVRKKSSHSSSRGSSHTTVHVMQDNDLIMTTETSGKVQVTIPKLIQYQSMYKVYVAVDGVAKVNEEVEILDEKGRVLRGRTDQNGIAYLSVVATPTPVPVSTPKPNETAEDIHTPYIFGYEDGTFKPDGFLTRAETASMLSGVLEITNASDRTLDFSDVKKSAWYAPIINEMAAGGLVNGYADGTFRPENKITRAEFITMLMQNEKLQKFKELPFSDISSNLWYADYIYSAYAAGYVSGYSDNTFKPDNSITRAEAVKILTSVLGRTKFNMANNPFADVTEGHWAYKYILEASVEHIKIK